MTWRLTRPFGRGDLADLHAARARVPGAVDSRTVAVSRTGFEVTGIDLALTPADLLQN